MSVLFRGLQRIVSASTTTGSTRILNNGGNLFPVIIGQHQQPFRWSPISSSYSTGVKCATKEEIEKLVKKKPLVVFMKGVPEEPRCGFSNAVVQVLRMHGVTSFDSYNVLEDEAVRQGVKEYSNWPTIPQIYINGEFIGGCDILLEMHKNGELEEQLAKAGIKSTIPKHDHVDNSQKDKEK